MDKPICLRDHTVASHSNGAGYCHLVVLVPAYLSGAANSVQDTVLPQIEQDVYFQFHSEQTSF